MRTLLLILMLQAVSYGACREGYVPTDVDGVCQASVTKTNEAWVSDEKPSFHPQPAYQRGEVTIIDAPNLEAQDRKEDEDRKKADAEGKARAGLKAKWR